MHDARRQVGRKRAKGRLHLFLVDTFTNRLEDRKVDGLGNPLQAERGAAIQLQPSYESASASLPRKEASPRQVVVGPANRLDRDLEFMCHVPLWRESRTRRQDAARNRVGDLTS
jgi:hypothetical protein